MRRHLSELLRLAVPVVIARSGTLTLDVATNIILGHYAAQDLAYRGLAVTITSTLNVTLAGLMMGTMVMVAQALGRGETAECGAIWRRSLPFALLVGLPATLLALLGPSLCLARGQTPEVASGAGEVLRILAWGLIPTALFFACVGFLEGIRRPWWGTWIMLGANLLNIVLTLPLVHGWGPVPALGAEGSAIATVIIRVLVAITALALIWWGGRFWAADEPAGSYGLRATPRPRWRDGMPQRRLGFAAGASAAVESTAFTAQVIFAGWLGVTALASYVVAFNTLAVTFMTALGIASATAVRTGIAFGRRDFPDLRLAGWTGLGLNTALMLALGAVISAMPGTVAGLFAGDAAVVAAATPLIALLVYILVFDGGQVVLAGALRGRGDTWIPTLTHFVSYWGVMIPLGWVLAIRLEVGVVGLFLAVLTASLASTGFLLWRFWSLSRA